MSAPTQPEPAEGPRDGDQAKPATQAPSTDQPAEGGENTAPRQPGSPRG